MSSIAHIGIAVKDLESAIQLFRTISGQEPVHREEVADQKVTTAMFDFNETEIELLQATSVESPIAKFVEKRGEGMHHIALEVGDIEAELERLSAQGINLIDSSPRQGAHGSLVAFLHPKSTNGVLIELTQKMR